MFQHSQVHFEGHFGSDESIVSAARVSFNAKVGEVRTKAQDLSLLSYLASGLRTAERQRLAERITECFDLHTASDLIAEIQAIQKHFAPFTHTMLRFRIVAPIFVARQLLRSQIGLTVSEVSRRYITDEPEFLKVGEWREAAADVKQGSAGAISDPNKISSVEDWRRMRLYQALDQYKHCLDEGVAPEQARMDLPQSMMTTWVWSGSLYAFARVVQLRTAAGAQAESGMVADEIGCHLHSCFPLAAQALLGNL